MTSRDFNELAQALTRAISAYTAGKLVDAEQLCQQIISSKSDHVDALHVLAVVQAALGKSDLALASYDRALALRPDFADALSNRGNTLLALNRFDEALESYDRALVLRPDFAEALSSKGSALEKANRLDEALASYDRALALRPDFTNALYNRGNVLKALKRYGEALASYDHAIALQPGYADAHNNRGQVLKELMRYDEALASYDRALVLQPQNIMVHCNAASLRLLTGDFSRGWADYEWRWMKKSVVLANRILPQPLWLGGETIAGKTILLHSEQGLGDTIQFCRYVPLVAARGAQVIFEVQKPLHALMSDLAGATQVISKGSPLSAFDIHCPLLSLPLAFGTRLETIPSAKAYLSAPARQSMNWQTRLGAKRHPRIGLAWSGNAGHERDRERSIGLRDLLPLLDAEATFVSLQKEVRAEDTVVLKERGDILHVADELKDFSDTAALISQLDLVISVDTSVAHLAGALGKPVWILVTYVPDWRWLLNRDDSPWYPTARLFRQPDIDDWESVIARVHESVRSFIDSRG